MVYVGTSVRAVHDTGGRVEPAAIDPALPVGHERDLSEPSELAYHALTPAQRATYLDLIGDLSAGAPCDAPAWCARLHLYGLERRVLVDFASRPQDATAPFLIARLARLEPLLDDDSRSVVGVLALLASSRLPHDGPSLPISLTPELVEAVPLAADVVVGWYEAGGRAIPLEVQLELLDVSVAAPASVLQTRKVCPEEFAALYEIVEHDEPLTDRTLGTTERAVVVEARSPSFKLPISVPTTVVEPAELASLYTAIAELADVTADDIDPYTRWRAAHPEADPDLARRLLLPPDLGGRDPGAAMDLIALARSVIERPGELTRIAELFEHWPLGEVDTMEAYLSILRVLDRAGVCVVPDPRFEDPVDLAGTCLVFASDRPAPPGAEMLWDLDMLRAAWRVIESDGQPNAAELWRLEDRLVAGSGRDPNHDARVLATYRWLRDVDTGWLALPDLAQSHHENEVLAKFLVALACADGHFAPAEHDALVEAFNAMGFDQADVDRLLDEITGHRVSHAPMAPVMPVEYADAEQPVAESEVAVAEAVPGERVDERPDAASSGDLESEPGLDSLPPRPSATGSSTLRVVESGDVVANTIEILRRLALDEAPTPARARAIAREYQLMWGAASEIANELALDRFGRLVCEEHQDEVEVHLDVLEQLT